MHPQHVKQLIVIVPKFVAEPSFLFKQLVNHQRHSIISFAELSNLSPQQLITILFHAYSPQQLITILLHAHHVFG